MNDSAEKGWIPSLGREDGGREQRRHRPAGQQQAVATSAVEHQRDGDQEQEGPGDRAGRCGCYPEDRGRPRAAVDEEGDGAECEGRPQEEGQAADDELAQERCGEPRGCASGRAGLGGLEDPREEKRRRRHQQDASQSQPQRRGERREQQAVARQVVPAVPVVVPQEEAVRREQLRAVRLRREVSGIRRVDGPRAGDRDRHQDGEGDR